MREKVARCSFVIGIVLFVFGVLVSHATTSLHALAVVPFALTALCGKEDWRTFGVVFGIAAFVVAVLEMRSDREVHERVRDIVRQMKPSSAVHP